MKAKTKTFTVRELLSRMTGVTSIGIYDKNENYITTEPNANELMLFADEPVDHFNVWIYDETRHTIQGAEYQAKLIRACIYLTKEKSEYENN